MTTFDILKEKREDVLEVAQRHGVTSMRVFGSVARGEESAESDIDLLVTTGPRVSPWFPAGLILELEQHYKVIQLQIMLLLLLLPSCQRA